MATYPTHVETNEASVKALTKTFKTAYKQIVGEIQGSTDFGVANRRALLSQINTILTNLGVDVNDFVAKELPDYYKTGADQGVAQLFNIGADVKVSTGFNNIHLQAIQALVSDTQNSFAEAISGVGRSATRLLNKTFKAEIQQLIATGVIKGSATEEAAKSIKNYLQEQGLSALTDKSGKNWQLDTYAEMLYRTKIVEARNTGLGNRMLENGYDLVQVSDHNSTNQSCADWEGAILSLTGATAGYDTVDDATAAGLFHPNCEHAINAIAPDLAEETKAYNPDTGDYEEGGGINLSQESVTI